MQEPSYAIWDWGDRTHDGRCRQYNVGVKVKAKRSDYNEFEVANELLCMRLGHVLKLPIPIGGLLEHDGHQWFASLNFATAAQRLPPVPCHGLIEIAGRTWLACGILLFDAWILNEDRMSSNLSWHEKSGAVHIFDHGAAFWDKDGRNYFESVRNSLVISRENHCLAGHVTSLQDFDVWYDRLVKIPEYFIRESLLQSVSVGFPQEHVEYCCEFLLDRRERLRELFRSNLKQVFPKLAPTLLDPFARMQADYCI